MTQKKEIKKKKSKIVEYKKQNINNLPTGTGAANLALTSFNLFGLVKIELKLLATSVGSVLSFTGFVSTFTPFATEFFFGFFEGRFVPVYESKQ